MFIDNLTNESNNFLSWLHVCPPVDTVTIQLQKDTQIWERLLYTSGRILNLTKCKHYILYWNFDKEGKATMMQKKFMPPIHITLGPNPTP